MTSGSNSAGISSAAPREVRVVFTPSGLEGSVASGTTVLDAARQLGVDLDSVCGGRGICGRCHITPSFGHFPKWALESDEAHLSAEGSLESNYRGKRAITEGDRLGCGVTIRGDTVIDVPAASQLHKQVVRKDLDLGSLEVEPTVTLHYLELADHALAVADTEAGMAIGERIRRALEPRLDHSEIAIAPPVLGHLHSAAATGELTVAVAVSDHTVIGAWPGYIEHALGVAIDVGSTTLAGHLCDLRTGEILASSGRMNPQIRFGEDLMSRVSYAMMHSEGTQVMSEAVRQAIDELIADLLASVGPLEAAVLVDGVAVGNPIMHHLLLGIDPTPLGQAPFPLATADPVDTTAAALGIDAPFARFHIGPCIAGHVGADTAAAVLAEAPHRGEAIQLLIDVGTNAEIVLGNQHRLFAASSPTGPAFEGAQISSGQRAAVGAIERVRIDRTTLEPTFKVIGCDQWSDDPAFDPERISVTGICGSGIIEIISELFLAGAIDAQGVIGADGAQRSARVVAEGRTFAFQLTESIQLTQADVRAVQLAKAALRAGIELAMEHAEFSSVDEIRLAGAFGANIDPFHAMVLGLIPDCAPDRVRAVGNSAGAGAVRALLSASQRREMAEVARSITKIETAMAPRFQEFFVAALTIPNLSAPTPHLASMVELPERRDPATPTRRRRRRSGAESQPVLEETTTLEETTMTSTP